MSDDIKIEGDIDINQALNEFQAKSAEKQAGKTTVTPQFLETSRHEVEGVKFETPSYGVIESYKKNTAKMVQLVMKLSGIKTERQAEYVLLGVVCISVLFSFYLWFGKDFVPTDSRVSDALMLELHPKLAPR